MNLCKRSILGIILTLTMLFPINLAMAESNFNSSLSYIDHALADNLPMISVKRAPDSLDIVFPHDEVRTFTVPVVPTSTNLFTSIPGFNIYMDVPENMKSKNLKLQDNSNENEKAEQRWVTKDSNVGIQITELDAPEATMKDLMRTKDPNAYAYYESIPKDKQAAFLISFIENTFFALDEDSEKPNLSNSYGSLVLLNDDSYFIGRFIRKDTNSPYGDVELISYKNNKIIEIDIAYDNKDGQGYYDALAALLSVNIKAQ